MLRHQVAVDEALRSQPECHARAHGALGSMETQVAVDEAVRSQPECHARAHGALGSMETQASVDLHFRELVDCESKPGMHRMYYWVKTEEAHEQEFLDVKEVVEKFGVPEHVLLGHIQSELDEEEAVKSLPTALILVILYALMNLAHDTQGIVRSVEEAFTYDIMSNGNFAFSGNMGFKGNVDVNSYADFWSWMNKGMSNLYFLDNRWVSESSTLDLGKYTEDEKQYYLNFNKKVAPLKLMQESVAHKDCANTDMSVKFQLQCNKEKQLDLTLDPTAFDIAQIMFSEVRNKTVFLRDTDFKSKLMSLETDKWLDPRTYRVMVSMLTYNGNMDLLMMTNVHFMFGRSGHIWKDITNRTFKLNQYDSWEVYLWDILFYMHITFILYVELKEVAGELRRRKGGFVEFLKKYMGFWNAVDWITILVAYVMLIVWLFRYGKVSMLGDDMVALPGKLSACSSAPNVELCQDDLYFTFYSDAEEAGRWIKDSNLLGAFYPVIIMLRLFKAFQAQPRLALVAMTLYNSAGDLAHFCIVFLAAFFSFVFTGIALFGQEVSDFAQFDRGVMTLFRMLMGDFDYDAMQGNDRIVAAAFVSLFQIAMFLIMLNMLVAIVMDNYAVTKANLMHGETLWEEIFQISLRGWENWKGVRVSFHKVKKDLFKTRGRDCDKHVTVITKEAFMQAVPGLTDSQAGNTMESAVTEWGEMHKYEVSMSELMSSASVAAACARATRTAMKQNRLVGSKTPMGQSPRGQSPLASPGKAAIILSVDQPNAAVITKALADNEGLSLEDIFKAAELRLEMERYELKDPAQAAALGRILQSLQLLSKDVVLGSVPAEACPQPVLVSTGPPASMAARTGVQV
mmetsp:Transcript_1768/g.6242  ORF Transcript_1768/g.6242 Transcript_1768/m.6242 type:complete len:854 (-) Transcript_1768:47-2608(-)